MFKFRLALEMGMPVWMLEQQFGHKELIEWIAYFDIINSEEEEGN